MAARKKMKSNIRYFIPFCIFLVLIVFLWKSLEKNPYQLPSALINKPLPHFNMSTLNGNQRMTENNFLGQVSLLNVWATWCISCRVEHPILLDISDSKAVAIYGLNYKDNSHLADKWLRDYGNPYKENIIDPKGHLGIDLGVYGTPETYIIDKQGVIRYKFVGPISTDDWRNTLLPVIEKLEEEKRT